MVLQNILPHTLLPRLRLIVIIREPIARGISEYNHKVMTRGNSRLADFCTNLSTSSESTAIDKYAAEVECQLSMWRNCLSAAEAEHSSMFAQYTACPSWDQVMVTYTTRAMAALLNKQKADEGEVGAHKEGEEDTDEEGRQLAGKVEERLPHTDGNRRNHQVGVAKGLYWAQLKRWKQLVTRQQLLVLSFDSVVSNASFPRVLRAILGFASLEEATDLNILPRTLPHVTVQGMRL